MSSDDIFEALSHPIRVEILKLLAKGPKRFAEIKRELRIESSGLLDFHMKKLENLLKTNDDDGQYVLNEKGFAALQAVEVISKYGWQKGAFFINLFVSILMSVYFILVNSEWAPIVLIISAVWIIFYGYWTFIKRRTSLKM